MRYWIALTLALAGCAASAFGASQNDVIMGNGGAGPYSLTWKNILKDTVTVSENGLTLTRGIDYTVDPNTGGITFSRPLESQNTALVQYEYDPKVAQRASTQLLSPFKIDLDQSGNQETYVSAAVVQSSTQAGATSSGNVAFSFGSQWKGSGRNQFGARLFFDPSVNSASQQNAPSKSAMGFAFNGSADAGKGSLFTFGFNRADKSLLLTDSGMQCGNQLVNMGLHIAPTQKMVADFGVTQTDPLDPSAGAGTKVQSTAAITVTPSKAMQVQANFGQTVAPGKPVLNMSTEAITATPSPAMKVQAQFGQTDSSGQASSNTSTVSVTATPIVATATTPGVDVTASTTQTTQGTNSTQQTALGLTVKDTQVLTISTGVNTARNQDVSHQTLSLNTILKPLKTLEIDAGYQNRSASANDTNIRDSLDTKSMQLSITPTPGWKLFGTFGENPVDGSGMPMPMFQRGLGLQSTIGHFSLTGGYNWNRATGTDCDSTALKLGLGWKLSANGQLTAGYQQAVGTSMTNSAYPWLTQYSFGYNHTLGQTFNVSVAGTYNQHPGEPVNGVSDVTGTASVGMKF